MKKIPVIANEIYHVCNRGVDHRKIFLDEDDYFRFIHDLFEFNDEDNVSNINYFFNKSPKHNIDVGRPYFKPRKLLVEILAFALMPNHYHLLIKPKTDNGGPEFMKKINGGYAKYFNNKYQRSGALFQGKYKAVIIKDEAHFIHIPYYIHANPLDLVAPEWREKKIADSQKAFEFLESYRWSSFLDYGGKKNFPSVTQREFLLNVVGGESNYTKYFKEWLNSMEISNFSHLALESIDVGRR